MKRTVRYYFMDNLRALAMTFGIFFHAALAYSPIMHEVWLTADQQKSSIVDFFIWFSHLFRMPLFFFIAGFFGHFLLKRNGSFGFIKNRVVRILVPLLIFFPLILGTIIAITLDAMKSVEYQPPILVLFSKNISDPKSESFPLSTAHLWFLYNLFLFYLCALIFTKFKILKLKIFSLISSRNGIIYLLPLLMVPSLYFQTAPVPAPERVYPELWSFGYFGIFFAIGWLFYNNLEILDSFKPYCKKLLIISIIMYIVMYSLLSDRLEFVDLLKLREIPQDPLKHFVIAVLEAYISVYMVFVMLVFGRFKLNFENKAMRYISDSSYWVYLIHLPILFFVQFILIDYSWDIWVKFLFASIVTLIIGMSSYHLVVRWTPLGVLLNGKRRKFFINRVEHS